MTTLHRIPCPPPTDDNGEVLFEREWLVTNGLGGYASGTISGASTRRFHGLLIAASPAPLGRMVMLNHLSEELKLEDRKLIRLDREEQTDASDRSQHETTIEFRLENGLPVWRYQFRDVLLEKRILLPYLQNTVHVSYRVLKAPTKARIRLRPSVHFRHHEAKMDDGLPAPYTVKVKGGRIEIESDGVPPLRTFVVAPTSSLVLDGGSVREIQHRIERARGYDFKERLWSPGYFRVDLIENEEATLIASTEDWETINATEPHAAYVAELQRRERLTTQSQPAAQCDWGAELIVAADQFIIRPTSRVADVAVAHAAGDDVRTVIAGYPWFTDWGRDTMISLEGLTLVTGRYNEAGYLLRTFGRYVRNGLIPNMFPEGEKEGLYHTADASLWYFHAIEQYLKATNDRETLHILLPILNDIVAHHVRGTSFGIHVDPNDGLLAQGQEGYQLTWMDAKVGDWVVTPRRGKAVEINALWYNALCLLERWNHEANDNPLAAELADRARKMQKTFNERFWFAEGGYLFDVVDGEQGNDTALRPNQVLACSLDFPVLDVAHWKPMLKIVAEKLLTPVGLRTLSQDHPDYKANYEGDLRARDAAYHQGTVWAWLIGPFIDAWLRVNPYEKEAARKMLSGFERHLGEACLGSISEIFDAEEPHTPRGCVAQAWSVAEVLRCLVKTTRC